MTVIASSTSFNVSVYTRQCLKALGQQRTFTTKLTEQQQSVQELVRNFAEQHLKPNAAKHDKEALFPFEPVSNSIYLFVFALIG